MYLWIIAVGSYPRRSWIAPTRGVKRGEYNADFMDIWLK